MLSLRQIEAFQAVVESGSFHGAARRLGTTQPAISKRIAEMEAALGVVLFDRSRKQVTLTLAGEMLLPESRAMLDLRARMTNAVLDPTLFAGTVRIGVTELVALTFLPNWVSAVREAFPRLRLRPEVGLAGTFLRGLREAALDLAILPGQRPVEALLDSRPLGAVEMAWMRRPVAAAEAGPIPAAALSSHVVLAQSEGSGLQAAANAWLAEQGATPDVVLSSNSLSALCSLTIAGLGTALLPRARFAAQVVAGRLQEVTTEPALPPLPYWVVFRRDGLHRITGCMAELAEATADFARGDTL
ncbi:LysR family transcriptional regulator [Roseicella frigidaeris]|uniref:LysR family transcriptional regulator n=1 Tax=Roseicella frigidaeris TaxID=2230885 RepID=A0A327MC31_9PROT|nr:LysR family transcriptional regulator [Roseicella frigidaeris]RAI59583.1 LysR family transcriptional regulator [Roseicella frigidaeris]